MIHVNRGPQPKGFGKQSSRWRDEFREAQKLNRTSSSSAFWSTVRRHTAMLQYVEVLKNAFHGKCCYCEAKIDHISPLHVEHFRPKGSNHFPNLMFVWENWLLACPRCNTSKASRFPFCDGDHPCFIDPAAEEPSDHIESLEAQILSKTQRGEVTIKEIALDRLPLTQDRARWLMNVQALLLLAKEGLAEARELLINCMQPNAPCAAMTRDYLKRVAPKLTAANSKRTISREQGLLGVLAEVIERNKALLQKL